MTLAFVFDENLPGKFSHAVSRHSMHNPWPLDVVRVGQPGDLPFGTDDRTILLWA